MQCGGVFAQFEHISEHCDFPAAGFCSRNESGERGADGIRPGVIAIINNGERFGAGGSGACLEICICIICSCICGREAAGKKHAPAMSDRAEAFNARFTCSAVSPSSCAAAGGGNGVLNHMQPRCGH